MSGPEPMPMPAPTPTPPSSSSTASDAPLTSPRGVQPAGAAANLNRSTAAKTTTPAAISTSSRVMTMRDYTSTSTSLSASSSSLSLSSTASLHNDTAPPLHAPPMSTRPPLSPRSSSSAMMGERAVDCSNLATPAAKAAAERARALALENADSQTGQVPPANSTTLTGGESDAAEVKKRNVQRKRQEGLESMMRGRIVEEEVQERERLGTDLSEATRLINLSPPRTSVTATAIKSGLNPPSATATPSFSAKTAKTNTETEENEEEKSGSYDALSTARALLAERQSSTSRSRSRSNGEAAAVTTTTSAPALATAQKLSTLSPPVTPLTSPSPSATAPSSSAAATLKERELNVKASKTIAHDGNGREPAKTKEALQDTPLKTPLSSRGVSTVSLSPSTTTTATPVAGSDVDVGKSTFTQKEVDQKINAVMKQHQQDLKLKDTAIAGAKKDYDKAAKELAKVSAKLLEMQGKWESEKASHSASKVAAKEKQAELTKDLKQAQKDTKDAVTRELRLQKEVDKFSASSAPLSTRGSAMPSRRQSQCLDASFSLASAAGGQHASLLPPDGSASAAAQAREMEEELKKLKKAFSSLEKEKEKMVKDLEKAQEKATVAEGKNKASEAQVKEKEKALAQFKKDLADAHKEVLKVEKDREAIQKELAKIKAAQDDGNHGTRSPRQTTLPLRDQPQPQELQKMKVAAEEAEKRVAELKEGNKLLEEKNSTLESRLKTLHQELEHHRRQEEQKKNEQDTSAKGREKEKARHLQAALEESERSANKLFEDRESLRQELQQVQRYTSDCEKENEELNEKLILAESELSEAQKRIQTLLQAEQESKKASTAETALPSQSKSRSPDKEGKIRMMLDKLERQEADFEAERRMLKQRLHELEDAVCEIQSQADERSEEARMLADSLEESERGREHVLNTWTMKTADLQGRLARLQALYEKDVREERNKAREELRAEADTLREALTLKTDEVKALQEKVSQPLMHSSNGALEKKVKELESSLKVLKSENLQLRTTNDQLKKRMEQLTRQAEEETEKAERVKQEREHTTAAAAAQSAVVHLAEFQQKTEARETLETEVAHLKQTLEQLQRQQAPPAPPSVAASTATSLSCLHRPNSNGNFMQPLSFYSISDEEGEGRRSQVSQPQERQQRRPSRARSPQEPHCLDTTNFDPTLHATPGRNSNPPSRASDNKENRPLSASRGASVKLSGPKRPASQSLPSAGAGCSLPINRLLDLDEAANGRGEQSSRCHQTTASRQQRCYSLSPSESLAGYSMPTTGAGAGASASVYSIAGAQPRPAFFTTCRTSAASAASSALSLTVPASPPGLSFHLSAGRLLVSHHGRRLERPLFHGSVKKPLKNVSYGANGNTPPFSFTFPSSNISGNSTGNDDAVSTSALASLSHRLHAARSHSARFAFTIRILEVSPSSAEADSSGGVLIGFADRFLPTEGFGTGRNSLRYEKCYYLNVRTGRLFCPGTPAETKQGSRTNQTATRLIDTPFNGWITAVGQAVAAREENVAFHCLSNDGDVDEAGHAHHCHTTNGKTGLSVAAGDEVTCCLNTEERSISYYWNGVCCGTAVTGLDLDKVSLYPAVEVNEGGVALEIL